MLNIKQKSRPDNTTRLELNSCSACGKHYQRLVTKVLFILYTARIVFLHILLAFSDARLCCLYGCSCVCSSHPAEENHAPYGRSVNLYQPCGKGESHAYCYDNNRSGSHQSRRHAAYYVAHLLASQFYVVFSSMLRFLSFFFNMLPSVVPASCVRGYVCALPVAGGCRAAAAEAQLPSSSWFFTSR